MLRVAAAAVVALLFSAPALAQSPAFDWTGVYVGGNAGYGWGVDDSVGFNYTPACAPASSGDCPSSLSLGTEGFVGGGLLGADWQHNMWVLGIEGDIDFSDINGSGSKSSTFSGTTTISASTDLDWLATLRARAGIAANRALFYATGGLAFGEVQNKASLTSGSTAVLGLGGTWAGSEDNVEAGWTIGGGAEYAATNNLIIGAEALYVDLGDNSVSLNKNSPSRYSDDLRGLPQQLRDRAGSRKVEVVTR